MTNDNLIPHRDDSDLARHMRSVQVILAKSPIVMTTDSLDAESGDVQEADLSTASQFLEFQALVDTMPPQDLNYNPGRFTSRQWEQHKGGRGAHRRFHAGDTQPPSDYITEASV